MRPLNRLARGGNHCDFCGANYVARLYACRNFEWGGRPVFTRPETLGRWAACSECAHLVEAIKWGRLHVRVMQEVARRKGITPVELALLAADLRLLHAAIREHMVAGEALTIFQPHYRRYTEDVEA